MPDNHCNTCGRPLQGTEAAKGLPVTEVCVKQSSVTCLLVSRRQALEFLKEAVEVMRTAQPQVKKRMEALRSQSRFDECSEAQTSVVELLECRHKIEAYLKA